MRSWWGNQVKQSESWLRTIQCVCSGSQNKADVSLLLLEPWAERQDGCIWGKEAGWVRGACLPCSCPVSGRVGSRLCRRWGRESVLHTLKQRNPCCLPLPTTAPAFPMLEIRHRGAGRSKSLMWELT